MENVLNHSTPPETTKDSYASFDNIDFNLDFEGRAIILNSIRLEGVLKVYSTGNTDITQLQQVGFDCKVGAHSLISQLQVTTQSQGVIENLIEYPRLVKMKTDASLSENDLLQSNYVCELRAPVHDIAELMVQRKTPKAYNGLTLAAGVGDLANIDAPAIVYPDFSIVPHMCLNQAPKGSRLSYEKTGTIRLHFILERNMGALFGRSANTNYNYKLSDLKVVYTSVPDGKFGPVQMRKSLCIKSSLTSATANLSSKVPAVCDSVAISYIPHSEEYQPTYSNVRLSTPPAITRMTYMFNDALNKFITFQITDNDEMIKRGLDGLMSGSSNDVNLNKIASNDGTIHGLNWGQFVDLSNQKFNVNIESSVSNASPYHVFMYFNSIVSV